MPGLTIHTDPASAAAAVAAHGATNPSSAPPPGTSSPTRPPISPITPPLAGASLNTNIPDFALGRPAFTHSQPNQTGIAPPPAVPIAFDDNPDVLALKSAISILQLQRARATADMQALGKAKAAALADPSAFVADLSAGRVGVEGDPLMFPGAEQRPSSSPPSSPSDSDSDTSSDSEEPIKNESSSPKSKKSSKKTTTKAQPTKSKHRKGKQKQPPPAPWNKLPKPQTIVRCPPINWAQYGVVGESLDKLHAEQVAAPTPGAPVPLDPGGTYEFKAGEVPTSGDPGYRLVGVAAPYTPGKDKIEKKSKGGKR